MSWPLAVLQNVLMGVKPIARLARRLHSTGLNGDVRSAIQVLQFYSRFVPIEGQDILEIGPGQTLEVLEHAMAAGSRSCSAVDVEAYVSPEQAERKHIIYRVYDGKSLPFESDGFDVIWSYTAFEHLRHPAVTVAECFRLLRQGGRMVALIDLGDHSFYGTKLSQPLKLFDCLRYSERRWNLMTWNRSSYVNRLRKSDWKRMVGEAGFMIRDEESQVSEEIARALPTLPYLHKYSHDDAVTAVLTLCAEKPGS